MKYRELKEGEYCRVYILKELLEVTAGDLYIEEFEKEESDILIQHILIISLAIWYKVFPWASQFFNPHAEKATYRGMSFCSAQK